MPNYSALNTQIDAVKSEITASLAVGTYTAQDLVYVAKALETLGQMLGINDIVAASADAQASLSSLVTNILNGTANSTTAKLYVGAAPAAYESSAALTNAIATFRWDENNTEASYAQIAFTNDDPTSSTDIIVYANNGDDATGWFGMGIAGNSFDDATYGITGPQDGYLFGNAKAPVTKTITNKVLTSNVATLTTSTAHTYAVGKKVVVTGVDATFNGTYTITAVPTTTTFSYAKTATAVASAAASGTSKMYFGKGNIVIATGDTGLENKIILAAGGYASGNEQLSITPDENVHIEIATPSTSASTGALTVVGGVGVQGDINVAGDVTIAGTITFGGWAERAYCFYETGGYMYIGGSFQNVNGNATPQFGLTRVNLSNYIEDPIYDSMNNIFGVDCGGGGYGVYAIYDWNSNLYCGGLFTNFFLMIF
jgi:hypothetical protein